MLVKCLKGYFVIKSIFLILILATLLEARTTCKNFDTQAQAQRYFDAKQPSWKRLDGDKDGEACECLYGGSAYDKSFCRKWREKHGKK